MNVDTFEALVEELRHRGFADDDIRWAERCGPPASGEAFAREAIHVVCNSGMQNRVAQRIYERVIEAVESGKSAGSVFGHRGKAAAIDRIWRERAALCQGYLAAPDKLAFCKTLPWIGEITKFHLAKNFGEPFAKPDVWLVRIATFYNTTAQLLCADLAKRSGYKVGTVDLLLWRAGAEGAWVPATGAIIHGRRSDDVRLAIDSPR